MSSTSNLCRCIYGTKLWEGLDPKVLHPDFEHLDEVGDEPPFQPPKIVGYLSYSVAVDQPLRGVPIREGQLWYLSADEKVEPVSFALYVNGFTFLQANRDVSISLAPFSLVRNCKFQSSYSNLNLSDFKIFKVSLFTHGICYYFGVCAEDERQAEEERSRWVLDISHAMRLVTQSLFPAFNISCDPIESVHSTVQRLMAGYLIHHEDMATVSVLYAELHPQEEEQAKLILYENELCQSPVFVIFLTACSICCEKVGINCSCFCIEDHHFSTRTLSERKLWLRAISNVKVKLQNRAPPPTDEDLGHYRKAIKDHISTIKTAFEAQMPMDALLQRVHRKAPKAVHLGDHDPEPSPRPDDGVLPRAVYGDTGVSAARPARKLGLHAGSLPGDFGPPDRLSREPSGSPLPSAPGSPAKPHANGVGGDHTDEPTLERPAVKATPALSSAGGEGGGGEAEARATPSRPSRSYSRDEEGPPEAAHVKANGCHAPSEPTIVTSPIALLAVASTVAEVEGL